MKFIAEGYLGILQTKSLKTKYGKKGNLEKVGVYRWREAERIFLSLGQFNPRMQAELIGKAATAQRYMKERP